MARKVFLSVLGTGFYNRCVYKKDGFKSKETRFIQQATLEHLNAKDWGEDDVVYVFLTESAKVNNWNIEGDKREKFDGTEEEYAGLEKELSRMGIKAKIEGVDIKDGNTEAELWENFSIIYDKLNKEDELYFDITHAFRYLPMFLLVLVDYAKFLKSVKVELVSYGNFEARDKDKNEAPLMDITSLVKLQEWTKAAADFVESGRVKNFTESVLSSCNGKVKGAISSEINILNKRLNEFEGQIITCRGRDLIDGKVVWDIKNQIEKVKKSNVLPIPLCEVLDSIANTVKGFSLQSFDNLIEAIEWCKKNNLIQQGFTLCQESIVTFLCEKYSDRNPYKDGKKIKDFRDYISAVLGVGVEVKNDENLWQKGLGKYPELTRSLFGDDLIVKLRKVYGSLTQNRNQINHAGFLGKVSFDNIKTNFCRCIPKCMTLLQEGNEGNVQTFDGEYEKKLFINFSNHPYAQWSEEQKKASEEFGECVDLQFPQIEPMATSGEISKLADEYEDKIKEIADGKKATVHIMGEMSFTYSMIERLKALGICCVCSTTYRLVKDEGNGKRYVEFQFRQFRNYV